MKNQACYFLSSQEGCGAVGSQQEEKKAATAATEIKTTNLVHDLNDSMITQQSYRVQAERH